MSVISDKQHNQTELSMLRCSLQLAIVNNLRNCEQFEIKSQFLKLFTLASSKWSKSASVTVTISTWACCLIGNCPCQGCCSNSTSAPTLNISIKNIFVCVCSKRHTSEQDSEGQCRIYKGVGDFCSCDTANVRAALG